MQKNKKHLYISIISFIEFILWTALISFVDIKAIGPESTKIGLATINNYFHKLIGVNMTAYVITDIFNIIPLVVAFSYAIVGFMQWIKRKKLSKVDYDIRLLGGCYILIFALYFFFEINVINYRPILINGILEASYPSSTTLLVISVMLTAAIQLKSRIKNNFARLFIVITISIFTIFMIVARIFSGVHWFSDILGGIFLSASITMMYYYVHGCV